MEILANRRGMTGCSFHTLKVAVTGLSLFSCCSGCLFSMDFDSQSKVFRTLEIRGAT